jgi:hypothetical protein
VANSIFFTRLACSVMWTIWLGSATQALALPDQVAVDIAVKAAERATQAARDAAVAAQAAAEAAKAAQDIVDRLTLEKEQPPKVNTDKSMEEHSSAIQKEFQVTANQQGGNATVKLTQTSDQQANGLVYAATLSSPLAKNSEITLPATLDGLYNAASLKVDVAKYFVAGDENAGRTVMVGASGKLGNQTFKFFDPMSLKKQNDNTAPWSAAIFAGSTMPWDRRMMLVGKLEYQRSYMDADTNVICPAVSSGAFTCVNGPIGEPKEKIKKLSTIEARFERKAFELRSILTYDATSHAKGADLLYYFINSGETADKPLPFSAGLDIGWRQSVDGTGPVLGIFVGTPFSFYGTP